MSPRAPKGMRRSTPLIFFTALVVLATLGAGIVFPQNTKENADFKLALNLYNDGLFDLAQEQLKQFIAAYPNTPQGVEARYTLGLSQLKLKQYEDARITFQTFALTYQDNSRAPEAWWNVGECYAAMNNPKEAALAFERVKVFHPKSKSAPDALVRAASFFDLAGEKDNARRLLRTVLQEYPASGAVIAARTQLGRIYFEEGNVDLAQNELKRVIDGDPSADARAQALLILGNIQQEMGKSEAAQSHYQEIISAYKTSSALQGAYVHVARLNAAGGKHAEAIDNLKKALALTKNIDTTLSKEALRSLGDAYAATGNVENAVSSYGRFLDTYPSDAKVPDVLRSLAIAAARARDFKQSNDASARLLRSDATDDFKRFALLRLAWNAREQKSPATALQYFNRYADLYPDDPSTPVVLFETAALVEHDLHDPRKASVVYELLVARHPHSDAADDALFGAARCQEKLHEYDRALQTYRDVILTYPASDLVDSAASHVGIIETFESKNKDAGLEKLALLVGDVVAEKDRTGFAFRLGEIYFHDIKNYDAAAAQFAGAIAAAVPEPRLSESLYLRARSLEYLSWKDDSRRKEAADAYREFLTRAPGDQRTDMATMAVFSLNAATLPEARSALQAAVAKNPAFPQRDVMLLRIGTLCEGVDSIGPAMGAYTEALRIQPHSSATEEAHYRHIALLDSAGLLDSALAVGTSYLQSYPSARRTALVLGTLGDLSFERGQADRAAAFYQQLTGEFPYTNAAIQAHRKLADALLAGGNPQGAVELYSELLHPPSAQPQQDQPTDLSLILALGKAYSLAGDTKAAKKQLFALLTRERSGERAAAAYTALGMIYKNEGATDIATSYFREAGNAAPGTAATREVADLLFDGGQYDDAVRQYLLLSKNSNNENERRNYDARAIVAKLRTNDLAAANRDVAAFNKTYTDTGTEIALFELERGNVFFRQNDYPRALKSFETVASKYDDSPSAPAAMYWIGKVYEATQRPQDAIKQFETLLREHPQADIVQKALFSLGNIYYRAEQWDAAIKNYRLVTDATAPDPALLPYAMSNLIETYETAGVFDAALTLTRKYLERYPNAEDAFDKRIKIGILYQRLGYYDQSVLHLQGLLDEAGSDLEGEIRYYIAEANYYKGDYHQAILDFLKVPYLVTKKGKIDWTATSLYMSGQSYEKMGRFDQALTMYKQIIDRPGIDETFKTAARKEIDRVNSILKKPAK
jgi:TolA-binding protein